MTPQEFDIIRATIKGAYPNFNIMNDKYSIQIWYKMLADLDYKVCETALMELFATHVYPPQIAEIRQKCSEYMNPQIEDSGAAWEEVQQAVRKYGYYRAEEAMQSLSPVIRKAINRIGGFAFICSSDNPSVSRAHFFKVYDAIANREKTDAMLPPAIAGRKAQYIEMASNNHELEDKHVSQESVEQSEVKRASQEYIDSLMKKYGFKNGSDDVESGRRE